MFCRCLIQFLMSFFSNSPILSSLLATHPPLKFLSFLVKISLAISLVVSEPTILDSVVLLSCSESSLIFVLNFGTQC